MSQSVTADERRPLPPGLPAVSVPLDAVYIDDKHSRCYVLKSALTALERPAENLALTALTNNCEPGELEVCGPLEWLKSAIDALSFPAVQTIAEGDDPDSYGMMLDELRGLLARGQAAIKAAQIVDERVKP